MRGSSLFHLTLGTIVVLIAGAAGQIANLERRTSPACSRAPRPPSHAQYPNSGAAKPTWTLSTTDSGSPTRVLVRLRGGLDASLVARIARQLVPTTSTMPSVPETYSALAGIGVLGYSSVTEAQSAVEALRRDPRVQYAELDAVWHVDLASNRATTPNDERFAEQWGLENVGQPVNGHPGGTPGVDIDARSAWAIGRGGEDVVVAVIDSGVDYRHEDLAANMWTNEGEIPGNGIDDDNNGVVDDVHGFNATDESSAGDPDDDLGHGTHVAGIVGAEGDNQTGVAGVNWTTRVMALKFLGPTGGGMTSDAIACIDYMLKMKARGVDIRVANCSWGSTERSQALGDAIDQAVKQGILFVCAAGNDGVDCDRVPHYPSSYDSDGIVSVAALTPNDSLASFSNYGKSSVDIAAPGVDVLSTLPEGSYGFASGTSMASPFVAGVAALVASTEPGMSIKDLRAHVLGGAVGVPDFASRLLTGGRLSGSAALAPATRGAVRHSAGGR